MSPSRDTPSLSGAHRFSAISQRRSRTLVRMTALRPPSPAALAALPLLAAVLLAAGGSAVGVITRRARGPGCRTAPPPSSSSTSRRPGSTACPGPIVQNADLGLPEPARASAAAAAPT